MLLAFYLLNIWCLITAENFEKQLRQCEIVIIYRDTCPHSLRAIETLNKHHFIYKGIEEDSNPQLVAYVRQKYHKTFPAIFVNGRFFGGNDTFQKALSEGNFPIQPALKLSDFISTIDR
jgi:glutaredoxin